MSHPDVGQGTQGTGSDEVLTGALSKQDRPGGSDIGTQPGNGTQQVVSSQNSNAHLMKQGSGQTQMPQHTGASPQQQLPTQPQQGGHLSSLHFPNAPTTSQSSRPKTPNRASPRPYHHPLTPTNRPPSTEPSEINLSPERLNASIAGLFPPKINIPLPPRQPNLNRGFDQQGLNPTTLKAIGQAPPSLNLTNNNNNGNAGGNNINSQMSSGAGVGGLGTKQDKQPGGQSKRASPSNSRRSSPASSRKSATPSPGRQKGAKITVNCLPHQQQLGNPQGQAMMLSPSSVPHSPVSMPSQQSGGMEAQQTQSPIHGIHGNPADGVRETQGMLTVERQTPQPQSQTFRDLSDPRITSPRLPAPQQSKPDVEVQANTADRHSAHKASIEDLEVSPALRSAPTSLNQLLDNTSVSNMTRRPAQSNTVVIGKDSPRSALDPDRPVSTNSQSFSSVVTTVSVHETEVKLKPTPCIPTSSPAMQLTTVPSSHLPTNVNLSTPLGLNTNSISSLVNPNSSINSMPNLCSSVSTNTNATPCVSTSTVASGQNSSTSAVSTSSVANPANSVLKPSPSPKPMTSVPSVIQIPASSTNISPNQIRVLFAPNSITSAPTSQVSASMVSTMMAVPNKNIRPQDIRQQSSSSRPAQFITTTPVFINPVFQVTGSSVAPSTTVVSQSVTMVGSIQVSAANIQLSPTPTSTQSSGATMASTQLTKSAVGQVHVTSNQSSSVPVGTIVTPQINQGNIKTEHLGDTSSTQKSALPACQPPAHQSQSISSFQPPLASPPCSSPGVVNIIRKSPASLSPAFHVKSKLSVSGSVDFQQSTVEKPIQGHQGTVPPQVFIPPASSAVQNEAQALHTTAVGSNSTLPVVSSQVPSQVTVRTQIAGQAPVLSSASVSNQSQAVNSQAPIVTAIGASTGVSSGTSLTTVTPVQTPVPSVVPIVDAPGPTEAPHIPSTPTVVPTVSSSSQPDPSAAEPSMPPSAEATQTTLGTRTVLIRSTNCTLSMIFKARLIALALIHQMTPVIRLYLVKLTQEREINIYENVL